MTTQLARLLRVKEAAEILGISDTECRRLLREGTIPGIRIGQRWRIHPDVLTRDVIGELPQKAEAQEEPKPSAPRRAVYAIVIELELDGMGQPIRARLLNAPQGTATR